MAAVFVGYAGALCVALSFGGASWWHGPLVLVSSVASCSVVVDAHKQYDPPKPNPLIAGEPRPKPRPLPSRECRLCVLGLLCRIWRRLDARRPRLRPRARGRLERRSVLGRLDRSRVPPFWSNYLALYWIALERFPLAEPASVLPRVADIGVEFLEHGVELVGDIGAALLEA